VLILKNTRFITYLVDRHLIWYRGRRDPGVRCCCGLEAGWPSTAC